MKQWVFKFVGTPKAVQSFRFTRTGRRYQPKEVVEWKKLQRARAISQLPDDWTILNEPVGISIEYIFPLLSSFRKQERIDILHGRPHWKAVKPDLTDNLNKGLIDALSGVIWSTDQLICKFSAEKRYGMVAHTSLLVWKLSEEAESKENLEEWLPF